jgi:hypothetical protein
VEGHEPLERPAAIRELLVVHRIEQARLLMRASRLICESTRIGQLFLAYGLHDRSKQRRRSRSSECTAEGRSAARGRALECGESEGCAARHRVEADWRVDAAEELDACLFDGWEPPILLVECASRSRSRWSSARALARAAFALSASYESRMQLARAELCEGSIERAAEMMQPFGRMVVRAGADGSRRVTTSGSDLEALVDFAGAAPVGARSFPAHATVLERRRADWLESAALASEAAGDWRSALEHSHAACRGRHAGTAALTALSAMALRMGAVSPAEWALARLGVEHAVSGEREHLDSSVLPRLRARIHFHRSADRWRYPPASEARIEAWLRADPITSAVARALS